MHSERVHSREPFFFMRSSFTFFLIIALNVCVQAQNERQYVPVNPMAGTFNVEWCTYVGSTDTDELLCVRDMPDGGVVVCGRTLSITFPGGDSLDTLAGSYDMVIFRMDSAGQVVWTTLYGGLYYESANNMVVRDSAIYVVGVTNGNDLPMINAWQNTTGGSYDAVILRIGFDGAIEQSSYFGSMGAEMGYGIDLDSSGNVVIGGSTTSASLPMSAAGFQPSNGGANDCFITVLNDSFAPVWTTFYGGSSTEDVHQLSVTPRNKIALIGGSFSMNFPCSPNAFQPGRLGNCDAYIVVFDQYGNREFATYYGGSSNEDCFGIASDSAGNIYLAGHTSSIDFNTTGTIFQPLYTGVNDAWIARFDSTGIPYFSTYFGGAGDDKTWSMMLRDGYLYVSGVTGSTDFPVNVSAPQQSIAGANDGFIVKMDTAGNYVASTYFGGAGTDDCYSLTVNSDTMVTCAGVAYSNNLPVTPGAYQPAYVASGDGFVTRYKLSEVWSSNGVVQSTAAVELQVYPNPSIGAVTVSSTAEIVTVNLYATDGRVVHESKNVNNTSVNIQFDLPPGMYVLQVLLNNGTTSQTQLIIAR
jgi:hypothetical protein